MNNPNPSIMEDTFQNCATAVLSIVLKLVKEKDNDSMEKLYFLAKNLAN